MSEDTEVPPLPASSLLAQIDAQQDDVLKQLDELNERLEGLLASFSQRNDGGLEQFPRAA
jgi:hypothetical protein